MKGKKRKAFKKKKNVSDVVKRSQKVETQERMIYDLRIKNENQKLNRKFSVRALCATNKSFTLKHTRTLWQYSNNNNNNNNCPCLYDNSFCFSHMQIFLTSPSPRINPYFLALYECMKVINNKVVINNIVQFKIKFH